MKLATVPSSTMTQPATNTNSPVALQLAIRIERDEASIVSSSRATSHDAADYAPVNGAPGKRGLVSSDLPQTTDPREPKASDYHIIFDYPVPVPITDGELRAIQVLLGRELQHLLSNDTTEH
jgi:hypothetical protein